MSLSPAGEAPATSRPRLIHLSTFPVHPRVGGGQQRAWHLARALSARFDIEFISLTASTESKRQVALMRGAVETVVPKSAAHEEEEARRGASMPFPFSDVLTADLVERSPTYLEAVRGALEGAAGVVLEHPYMFPALAFAHFAGPVFYDAHNAEVRLKAESLPDTPEGKRLLDVVRSVEGAALAASRLVFSTTDEDQAALEAEFGTPAGRFILVPNGVDTGAIPFADGATRRRWSDHWHARFVDLGAPSGLRYTALFVASLHGPNIDAAQQVLAMADAMKDVVFVMAGSVCDYFGRLPVPANVVLLGTISDSAKNALLCSAEVALNPMVQGSGSNIKMLDYLAAGIPVVSTAHGARGIDLGRESPSVVISAPGEFPAAIRTVLADPTAATAGAAAGRRLVVDHYDWQPIGRHLLEAVTGALDTQPLPA